MCPNVCAHWIWACETPHLWGFFMNTNSFFFLFILATNQRLSCCSPMLSLSLPFALSEDLNTMLLSDVYPTPRLYSPSRRFPTSELTGFCSGFSSLKTHPNLMKQSALLSHYVVE
jgi:hypothetical protein